MPRFALSTLPLSFAAWPWPLPAVLAWAASWAAYAAVLACAGSPTVGLIAAAAASIGLASGCRGPLRRAIAVLGFPLSIWALGIGSGWPAWSWLLLLLPLLTAYPLRAWSDAPFFPTPSGALGGLPEVLGSPRRVLDAGCGLGHGLRALRALWPEAELEGLEWSPLLAWAAGRRCPYARVRRADMWAAPWAGHDVVYLFQRPESMDRAYAKARRELSPGAWLVSLEFPVPQVAPTASLQHAGRRPLWLYRMPQRSCAAPVAAPHSTDGGKRR